MERGDDSSAAFAAMASRAHREAHYAHGAIVGPGLGVRVGWTAHRGSMADVVSSRRYSEGTRLMLAGEMFDASGARSDARSIEALVERLRSRGTDALQDLNGLFAGVLIDPVGRRVLMFNDRFGAERLYVLQTTSRVYFASEAKCILNAVPASRQLNPTSVAQFLKFGSVAGDSSLFSGIRVLPGGSAWSIRAAAPVEKLHYFDPASWECQAPMEPREFAETLASTLMRVIPRHFDPAGSPVGVALTGGLDSRMIMAVVASKGLPARCVTFSGAARETLDARIARRVAAMAECDHITLRLPADFLPRFGEHVDRAVAVTDACAGATTAHEIPFTAMSRAVSPVRLTGNFGSEILRGVSTLKPWIPPAGFFAADFATVFSSSTYARPEHPTTAAAFAEVPWHLYGPMAAGRSQLVFRTPFLDNEIVSLAYRTSGGDRSHSDACLRAVDAIAPALAAVPTDRGLAIDAPLRSWLRGRYAALSFKVDYLDKEGLPSMLTPADPLLRLLRSTPLLGQHKYLSYRTWFRNELAPYLLEALTDARTSRLGLWQSGALERTVRAHIRGERNALHEIAAALTLEAADRLLLPPRAHCTFDSSSLEVVE